MKQAHETIDRINEVAIYLFLIFMFLSKGEGVRTVLIVGNFVLWLFTLRERGNLNLLRRPVSVLFWVAVATPLLSTLFSIDRAYSLHELKDEPLKSALLFPVIATVMSREERLFRASQVMLAATVLMVSIGFYSYIAFDLPVLKPATILMTVWHNKFARYLCTYLPFAFALYLLLSNRWQKAGVAAVLLCSLVALILSTSRGGYIALLAMMVVWTLYLSRVRGFSLKRALSVIAAALLLLGALSWAFLPPVRERMSLLPEQISTLNERTTVWLPALYAARERPLVGWGYGSKIFRKEEPFANTPFRETPPTMGEHNTFLWVLFHQGLIGLIPYLLLILLSIREFWTRAALPPSIKDYVLVSCVSVLIGNYILHSMLAVHYIPHLAVLLGFGVAATGTGEDRHR